MKLEALWKLLARFQCTQSKAAGDHYSAGCLAKAKANFTQAKIITAVAAEFGKQYEVKQQAAGTAGWYAGLV